MRLAHHGMLIGMVALVACAADGSDSSDLPGGGSSGISSRNADDWMRSGLRLKVTYLESRDGARQFAGWRDTKINAECSFARHSGGFTRCLPGGPAVTGVYWNSNTCDGTQLVASPKGAGRPAFATMSTPTGARVFNLTGEPVTSFIHIKSGTSCVVAGAGVLSDADYYALASEVPGTEFIDAETKVAP